MLIRKWLALGAAAVVGVALPVAAQAPEGGKEAAKSEKVAPAAQRVLDRVREHYKSVQGVSVTGTMKVTAKMGEDETTQEQSVTIKAARPNKALVRMGAEGMGEYTLASDGETLWQHFGTPLNKYQSDPAPKGFEGVMQAASFGQPAEPMMVAMQPQLLVLAAMDGAALDRMVEGAQKVEYLGKEDLEGKSHERVRLVTDRADVDLWVPAEGEAWIARTAPDLSRMFAQMKELMPEMDAEAPKMEARLTGWKSEAFDAEAFAFTPPEGAEKVDSLLTALQAGMEEEQEDGAAHAELLGSPAPELDLAVLGGGKASLAAHKGKDVVVLDFWATWCPPCVRGLPVLAEVTGEYKGKGVVFYAVNVQEGEDKIRKFLEKHKLDITVALDSSGKAGNAYGVSGIPQTVLIGKDGTVQAIHVGFMPGVEKELKEQIEALLAGKALAGKK